MASGLFEITFPEKVKKKKKKTFHFSYALCLMWPKTNSARGNWAALPLQCQHHCNLYTVFLVTWHMPVTAHGVYLLEYFPSVCMPSNLCLWHLRGIFVTGIYMVIDCKYKLQFVVLWLLCVVMWGLYEDCSSSAVGHIYLMWHAYLFRAICQ